MRARLRGAAACPHASPFPGRLYIYVKALAAAHLQILACGGAHLGLEQWVSDRRVDRVERVERGLSVSGCPRTSWGRRVCARGQYWWEGCATLEPRGHRYQAADDYHPRRETPAEPELQKQPAQQRTPIPCGLLTFTYVSHTSPKNMRIPSSFLMSCRRTSLTGR